MEDLEGGFDLLFGSGFGYLGIGFMGWDLG